VVEVDWLYDGPMRIEPMVNKSRKFLRGKYQLRISSEMVLTKQEEVKTNPEEEVKSREEIVNAIFEDLKFLFEIPSGSILGILLKDVTRSVLDEAKVRLTEEMIRFRKSMADQLLICSYRKMDDTVNLLKLEDSFRAAWNKWLETPKDQKAEEAYKVFEWGLFQPKTDDEQTEADR